MLRTLAGSLVLVLSLAARGPQRGPGEGQLVLQGSALEMEALADDMSRAAESAEDGLGEGDDEFAMDPREIEAFQEAFRASGCEVQRGPKMHGMCAYNRSRDDEYELDPDAGVGDPRNTFKDLGYTRGFKAKLWQLGRAFIGTRKQYVELPGMDAREIAQAMYGIIVTKVPEACFGKLRSALTYKFTDNHKDNFRQIRQAKPNLLRVLTEVKTGCGLEEGIGSIFNRTAGTDARGLELKMRDAKRAAKLLHPIKLGYWGLLPELTIERSSVLAVRVYDELRVLRGDTGLRQIWHYGMLFMAAVSDARLREKINQYKSEKHRKWALSNLRRLYMIMSYRDAHLEWMELDNQGSCLSAPKRDPMCMLTELGSYSSANFRMVLMFRERHWQAIGKAIKGWFDHPILAMKKYVFRTKDVWQRGGILAQLGLVLGPLMQAAHIGGLVLRAVTAGSSTLSTVIAGVLGEAVGIEVVLASQGLVQFVVSELFGTITARLDSSINMFAFTEAISRPIVQKVLARFDDKLREAVLEVQTQIDLQIENLLTDDRVLAEVEILRQKLKKAHYASVDDEEAGLALEDSLEDELRRYVSGIVHEEFSRELEESIEEKLEGMVEEKDPEYGWLKWDRWRRYREGHDASQLKGVKLRYMAPEGSSDESWEGTVLVSHDKSIFSNRDIEVQTAGGKKRKVELSDKTKKGMWVKDFTAYRKSMQNSLLWYDWKEYRHGGISKLSNREIFLDTELASCSNVSDSKACLAQIASEGNHVVKSINRMMKVFGSGVRVKVMPGIPGGEACKFDLTPQVKRCLRIRDADAYRRFQDDRPRHEKDAAWKSGELNATTSIVDKVVKAVKGAADCKTRGTSRVAAITDAVLAGEQPDDVVSEELETVAGDADPERGADKEEKRGMREAEQTAISAFCG